MKKNFLAFLLFGALALQPMAVYAMPTNMPYRMLMGTYGMGSLGLTYCLGQLAKSNVKNIIHNIKKIGHYNKGTAPQALTDGVYKNSIYVILAGLGMATSVYGSYKSFQNMSKPASEIENQSIIPQDIGYRTVRCGLGLASSAVAIGLLNRAKGSFQVADLIVRLTNHTQEVKSGAVLATSYCFIEGCIGALAGIKCGQYAYNFFKEAINSAQDKKSIW